MDEREGSVKASEPKGQGRRISRFLLQLLLALAIVAGGIGAASYLKNTGPEPRRRQPVKRPPLVQAVMLQPQSKRVMVEAMGTVVPARELVLKAEVPGEVIYTHPQFFEGGLLRQGEEILRLDPADYELAVIQKQSEVVAARYQLKLEQGRQQVARREWALLNGDGAVDDSEAELALRKPHLEKAMADLRAAEAALAQAELDLARTRVRAPFNAVVRSKRVEIGSRVAAHEELAQLVGTDSCWIRVSVPLDRIRWIRFPRGQRGQGSRVHVFYGGGQQRRGRVLKLLSDLEPEGRLARVLVEVRDPLNLEQGSRQTRLPLLIGDYVRVEIEGVELANVYRIPRGALRDGTKIWVVGSDLRLDIRPVQPLWADQGAVFITDRIAPGERLVVSEVPNVVSGMKVRLQPQPAGSKQDAGMQDDSAGEAS